MKLIRIKVADQDTAETLSKQLGDVIAKVATEFSKPVPAVPTVKALAGEIVALAAKKAQLKG